MVTRGAIKKLTDKGYGFIVPEDGGDDLFFHATGMDLNSSFDDLEERMSVEYEVGEGPKGKRAEKVKIV